MIVLLEKICQLLVGQYQFDVSAMSQPWMYWCGMVPIIFYMIFFFIKWAVLLAPLWLPLAMVSRAFHFEKTEKKESEK